MVREKLHLRVGTRRWDHLVPLTLKDVTSDRIYLEHVRLPHTPTRHDWQGLDAGEVSLSRLLLGQLDVSGVVGLPAFPLASFRHRCIIVRSDSSLTALADLRGKSVGLTGWADSGNIWTKSLLTDENISLDEIDWVIGPLREEGEQNHITTRQTVPPYVRFLANKTGLIQELLAGRLDAILSSSLPNEIYGPDPDLRHLLPQYPLAEKDYYLSTRTLPLLHVLAIREEALNKYPWVAEELVHLFRTSFNAWLSERTLLLDTTPWLSKEIAEAARFFPDGWNPYAISDWKRDVTKLVNHQRRQGLRSHQPNPLDVFVS